MNITDTLPAYKMRVLLGVDKDGEPHVVAKGPEPQKQLLADLTVNGGKCNVDGKDVQLVSAAILGGGQYRKRKIFNPNYKAEKPAPLSDEQKKKQAVCEAKNKQLADEREAGRKKLKAAAVVQRKANRSADKIVRQPAKSPAEIKKEADEYRAHVKAAAEKQRGTNASTKAKDKPEVKAEPKAEPKAKDKPEPVAEQ